MSKQFEHLSSGQMSTIEQQVANGATIKEIAARYGVKPSTIALVLEYRAARRQHR